MFADFVFGGEFRSMRSPMVCLGVKYTDFGSDGSEGMGVGCGR